MAATDGEIGSVANFLLDDQSWVVRYLVVETGTFLDKRRVLISPVFFRKTEWSTRRFHLSLTVDKVKNSPSVDLDKPVSQQHERDYYRYYAYPYYLETSGLGDLSSYPVVRANPLPDKPESLANSFGNVHLRSAHELVGYHIHGNDESIGHVQDFIIDDEGELGAPNLAHPPAKTGAYSASSSGVDTSSGESSAEGPIPPPEP